MDSMLQLFRSELLPKAMVEVSVPQAAFHVVSNQIYLLPARICPCCAGLPPAAQ